MKLGLLFWYGDDAGALPVADEIEGLLAGLSGTPSEPLFHLVNAFSRIEVAPWERATTRAVRRALALHERWAAAAPANYAAPEALVRGAWLRARGEFGAAERHLDRAIALADQHQLPLVGALAHEQAAALYVQTGRPTLQRFMVRAADERWVSLDIVVRCERLTPSTPGRSAGELVTPGSGTVDPVVLPPAWPGGHRGHHRRRTGRGAARRDRGHDGRRPDPLARRRGREACRPGGAHVDGRHDARPGRARTWPTTNPRAPATRTGHG